MTSLRFEHFHFLGICGTAMGALASALHDQGYIITGSDDAIFPPMSTFLESKHITLFKGFDPKNIPQSAELIIVGNAMKRGNPELEDVLNRKLLYTSLPEALKTFFLQGKHNLVVTGTHGKTTTTSLLTWLLQSADLEPGYLIGGLPNNFGKGAHLSQDSSYFVIEGDEYDTAFFDKRSKFFHYLPSTLIINNIEFDHADIYQNIDQIKLSFSRLVNMIPSNGTIFYNSDDPHCVEVVKNSFAKAIPVGLNLPSNSEGNVGLISHIVYDRNGKTTFQLGTETYSIPISGEFNVRNAAMAIMAAKNIHIPQAKIQAGLDSFLGIRRRQEVRGEVNNIRVIDDFGHHPTAIKQTLKSLRQQYAQNGGRIWALFEPRSNTTRRSVFQNELVSAFNDADGVIIAKVARFDELPESERLNPNKIIEDIKKLGKIAYYQESTDVMVDTITMLVKPGDTIVVFSNGGFDNIHAKLLDALSSKTYPSLS